MNELTPPLDGREQIQFDPRQLSETRLALYYERNCHHGTVGHNGLMQHAAMAKALGFRLGLDQFTLYLFEDVKTSIVVDPTLVSIIKGPASSVEERTHVK